MQQVKINREDHMTAKVLSFAMFGIEPYPIEIEVDVARGLPGFTLVGLADKARKGLKRQ
jgi:magnesium chelatase family protein